MATLSVVRRALEDCGTAEFRPRSLLELGTGDGSLILRLARPDSGRF